MSAIGNRLDISRSTTMYRTFEEEVFLAPETIISGVLEAAALDDLQQLPDPIPTPQSVHAAGAEPATDDEGTAADTGEPADIRAGVDPVDAWSRHARGANGFGG
jgi:hypothetical protein